MDVDCGRQTSGGGGARGGQKLAKSYGHLLCMTPNDKYDAYITICTMRVMQYTIHNVLIDAQEKANTLHAEYFDSAKTLYS